MRAFTPEDLFALIWLGDCNLSPDGHRVALTVTRLDKEADRYRSAIWVIDAATGEAVQFTAGAGRDFAPRWSPDGKRIAFLSERPGDQPTPQLAVISASGGESRVLTSLGYGAGTPVWAPDSRRLVFAAKTGTPPDPKSTKARPYRRIEELKSRINGEGWYYDCRRHLFVIDIDAATPSPAQITDGPWDDVAPAWSPTDDTIAFVSSRHDTRDKDSWSDIFLVPATGGTPTRLTAANAEYEMPSWSPDGSTLALLGRKTVVGTNGTIHLLSRAGGTPTPIDPTFDRQSGAGNLGGAAAPIWLDATRVVSAAEDRGDTALIVAAAGAPTAWLARRPRHVSAHTARAGCTRIAFVASTPTAPSELFVFDTNTGEERQLTRFNTT